MLRQVGAIAKQKDLEQRWPALSSVMEKGPPQEAHEINTTADTSVYQLDLSTVIQTSQAISSEIVLNNLLKKIMQLSITNAGAQRGFLVLETEGRLSIEAGGDSEEGEQTSISKSLPLAQCDALCHAVVNYVWRSHEPVILSNASEDGPFSNDPYIREKRCKSILCMPILNKKRLSGILYMENNLAPNAFTEERLHILGVIVSQAAISLDNARLFDQATTDGLTRLFVHRYFQFLLGQEIERSRRHSRPCSLIMMDIDNFKHFNDTYGHQLGDEVLKKVAAKLKKNIRATDIAARYGGEEFVAVLPETAIDQALVVAEKIRSIVENLALAHNGKTLRVTISLGVAVFPDEAANKDELIRLADNALYSAKRAGKNCVRTA